MCTLRENAPPLLYFFLVVVVAILSSVKKHPPPCSRWNQSAFLSFRSTVGKSFHEDKEQEKGGRQWKWSAGVDDSVLFHMDVFHLFFFSLFPPLLWVPYLTFSVLPHPCPRPNRERLKPLPSSCSFFPHLLTSNKKKRMTERS